MPGSLTRAEHTQEWPQTHTGPAGQARAGGIMVQEGACRQPPPQGKRRPLGAQPSRWTGMTQKCQGHVKEPLPSAALFFALGLLAKMHKVAVPHGPRGVVHHQLVPGREHGRIRGVLAQALWSLTATPSACSSYKVNIHI